MGKQTAVAMTEEDERALLIGEISHIFLKSAFAVSDTRYRKSMKQRLGRIPDCSRLRCSSLKTREHSFPISV